jgi:CBS domain-containing protein
VVVRLDDLVCTAVQAMREKQLGCAIAVDDAGVATGCFTERTLIDLLLAGHDMGDQRVGDHLDPEWFEVHEQSPVATVYQQVVGQGARFVCVVDDEGKPRGLTGQRGLAEYVAEHYPRQVMTQPIGTPSSMKQREGG